MKKKNYELDDKVDEFIEWYKKNKIIVIIQKQVNLMSQKELEIS